MACAGRRRRLLVAAEAVVQDRGRPVRVDRGEPCPLAAACSIAPAISAEASASLPLQCPEPQQRVGRDAAPGRRRHAVGSPRRARRRRRSRPIHARRHAQRVEVERQLRKRAGVADELDLSRRDRDACPRSPTRRAGGRGHPAPAQDVLYRHVGERFRCSLQRRRRGGASVGGQQREPVEQQVERRRGDPAAGGRARTARQISTEDARSPRCPAVTAAPQAVR